MTTTIDAQRALELLREAVEARGGDTVVEVCRYVHGHQLTNDMRPGCLVGEALHRAGVTLGQLDQLDNPDDEYGESHLGSLLRPRGDEETGEQLDSWWTTVLPDVTLTDEAVQVLRRAQRSQDRGDTWATALGEASAG